MDRKIVVFLVAKRINEILENFTWGHMGETRLYIGSEPEEFKKYLLDIIPEAVSLIKEEMAKMAANKQSR